MSEPACVRRLRTAAQRAVLLLDDDGYQVFFSDGNPFHLIAVKNRKRKVRFIRIIEGKIKADDRHRVGRLTPDSKIVSRELWLRKRGDRDFSIILVPFTKV